jgi:hypothetical protein
VRSPDRCAPARGNDQASRRQPGCQRCPTAIHQARHILLVTAQITRSRASATTVMPAARPIPNGGTACVLPGRARHSALRCRAGINRGRGYRPGTGRTSLGEPVGDWPGSRCRAQPAAGTSCAGTLVVATPWPAAQRTARHGRHRFDLHLCGAGRRGLPDGGSTRFYGGSTRWQGHRGGSWRPQREAVAALSRGGRLVMRLPQSGPGTGRRPGRRPHRFTGQIAVVANISEWTPDGVLWRTFSSW